MKKLIFITTILAIAFTSCLKDDKHYIDFANAGNIVNMPQSGLANFSKDALTKDIDTIEFAVDYATAKSNKALTVTIAVDPTLIAPYVAANPDIAYEAMPEAGYKLASTTISIPAGAQYAFATLYIDKTTLDPAKSYMLPIVIKDAQGIPISSNMNVHYYHSIGNDFAGDSEEYYDRWSTPDTIGGVKDNNHVHIGTETLLPVSPTEFTVRSFYFARCPYHVTFVKTGTGASATYSNFQVKFTPADVDAYFTSQGLTMARAPVIVPDNGLPYDPAKEYTYAEALHLFRFYYLTATRGIIDSYKK